MSTDAAMQMERDHVAALIDSLPDGVLECELDGVAVHANDAVCRLVGRTRHELVVPAGTSGDDLDPHDLRRVLRDVAARFVGHDEDRRRVSLRRHDGSVFDAIITTTLLQMPHAPDRLVVVLHDATEDDRIAAALAEARAVMRVADDRDRIARDLHDLVIQRLFAAGLRLEAAGGRGDLAAAVAVTDELDAAITEIRRSIFMLHRPRGLHLGLEVAMANCVAESARILDHRPSVELLGLDRYDVAPDLVEDIVAVARELLSNVARHARARSSSVRVVVTADGVALTVEDDGIGTARPETAVVPTAGLGLRSVDERAARRGGSVAISAREPAGTTVTWSVPRLQPPAATRTIQSEPVS